MNASRLDAESARARALVRQIDDDRRFKAIAGTERDLPISQLHFSASTTLPFLKYLCTLDLDLCLFSLFYSRRSQMFGLVISIVIPARTLDALCAPFVRSPLLYFSHHYTVPLAFCTCLTFHTIHQFPQTSAEKGAEFLKHGRHGQPHMRHVFLDVVRGELNYTSGAIAIAVHCPRFYICSRFIKYICLVTKPVGSSCISL